MPTQRYTRNLRFLPIIKRCIKDIRLHLFEPQPCVMVMVVLNASSESCFSATILKCDLRSFERIEPSVFDVVLVKT